MTSRACLWCGVLAVACVLAAVAEGGGMPLRGTTVRLTDQPSDDDWPAAATDGQGRVWVAYTAYKGGPPLNPAVLHGEQKFDSLVAKGKPTHVYNAQPNQQEIGFTWTDESPAWGKEAYYYVRVEQPRPAGGFGALAGASPMWITAEE